MVTGVVMSKIPNQDAKRLTGHSNAERWNEAEAGGLGGQVITLDSNANSKDQTPSFSYTPPAPPASAA